MRLGGRIAAAVEILEDTSKRRRPVADALKDWGLAHRFAGSGDRAAIGNIVYDVLRAKRSLGWRMGDDSPRALVLAAIMDNRSLDGAGLAAALEGDRFAPTFPNEATLKRFAEADLSSAPDAVRADLPDWLAAEFAEALGEDWIAEAAALSARPPLDIRANALVATPGAVLCELSPFGAEPAGIAPDGIRIPPIAGDGRHPNVQVEPGFLKGAFEIQDEGSQIAARLVEAAPGETILDICAGAGGKTLALAAAMRGEGRVHAFDSDRQRLAPIYDRLKRAEATHVEVHGPRDDLSALSDAMDRVVVDAPCTGTGTFRRRPDAKWRLAQSAVEKRMGEQDQVLDSAARYVKRGGVLAYITCSLLARENRARIAAFLERHPDFKLGDAEGAWARVLPGAGPRYRAEAMAGGSVLTLTPRLTGTDGFFFARLERR
ncbi:MFS transporter [Aureimonas sp. Leaf454]|uniref:RsmB/NOP family class I SAM-dependent RNA methyltransferase n=1 Tax=Aureimonas sp. Leaf454 TaxID=1736381 RepID=UPI0006F5A6BA|nr:RsmB/NOP family class I SAM-dependent RNA methyltransferase [Aureimonas sp. Leaf454]KQT44532.1 MFS transporter [Aureimonas sp. Leaf454]